MVCPQLVYEVRNALVSPRLAQRYEISESDAEVFARKLTEEGLMLDDPKDPLRVVPDDPKDDYLVALAIESGTLTPKSLFRVDPACALVRSILMMLGLVEHPAWSATWGGGN